MASFALDPTYNDWTLAAGRLVLVNGAIECAQKIAARLSFFRASWFRDVRQGVPYWETIFKKSPDVPAISQMFRRIVLDTPGVKSVESLTATMQRAQRILTVNFVARHDSGAVIEGGTGKPFLVDGRQVDSILAEAA